MKFLKKNKEVYSVTLIKYSCLFYSK